MIAQLVLKCLCESAKSHRSINADGRGGGGGVFKQGLTKVILLHATFSKGKTWVMFNCVQQPDNDMRCDQINLYFIVSNS